ncbi:MAG: TetR/AcrR family transcriptional regulator [Treponema sp.]|nr:TetR/AcrR family transcriptional regulator [Treponema sp.]
MAKTEKITREKIILAFLESCFEKNAGGTSLSDVAGRLGIKKASLYNHYESRDAMVEDTLRWSGEYMKRTYFIPSDIDAISRKYSAETVMKGIVNRWFKLNEKEPLFQIYSFVESEKYISNAAAEISQENREKLISQTATAFLSLSAAGKIAQITEEKAVQISKMYAGIVMSFLDSYLTDKKIQIRTNPETGEGSLFAPPQEKGNLDGIDSITEDFCALLKP